MIHADDWLTVYAGDCRAVLATLPAESVHCVVTSPPYWGLRDYGQEGQLGLEPAPEQYVENMVAVFREVRRVLRNDGTLWLNLGDSYAGSGAVSQEQTDADIRHATVGNALGKVQRRIGTVGGLKPKDLVGIPWRVAFALQADGWYLRSDIIWSKPNPMPESVTDRPTKSHEYVFLLSKSPRYYFDADAVREKATWVDEDGRPIDSWGRPVQRADHHLEGRRYSAPGLDPIKGGRGVPQSLGSSVTDGRRNIRSVWTIATQPYPGAHFAVFPPKLVEPCIKAGTSEKGVCPECGAPWRRVVEIERRATRPGLSTKFESADKRVGGTGSTFAQRPEATFTTTGWQPSCVCGTSHVLDPATPAVVLDPFAGSGTVGMVAQNLSRRAVLIDLNPSYIEQQLRRNRDMPLGLSA